MTIEPMQLRLAAVLATLCIVLAGSGCGDDLVVGGMLLPTVPPVATATPGACLDPGFSCDQNSDCCSLVCDATSATCL